MNILFVERMLFLIYVLKIKDTIETSISASDLDLLLSVIGGTLPTKLYDKRDVFEFGIVNFSYICSNIHEFPAYGVYISQLIRYAVRAFCVVIL